MIADDAVLVPIVPDPLAEPDSVLDVSIDLRGGLLAPGPIHAELILQGDAAVSGNLIYSSMAQDARERTLRAYWRGKYDGVEISSVTVSFDPALRRQTFVMDGRYRIEIRGGRYRVSDSMAARADLHRDPGPNADAPFAVAFPY